MLLLSLQVLKSKGLRMLSFFLTTSKCVRVEISRMMLLTLVLIFTPLKSFLRLRYCSRTQTLSGES